MGPVWQNPIQRTVRTARLSVLMTVHSFSTQHKTVLISSLLTSSLNTAQKLSITGRTVQPPLYAQPFLTRFLLQYAPCDFRATLKSFWCIYKKFPTTKKPQTVQLCIGGGNETTQANKTGGMQSVTMAWTIIVSGSHVQWQPAFRQQATQYYSL